MPRRRLDRAVVMLTGASAGVGRAGLQATAREVRELGGEALVLPADVASDSQVRRRRDELVDAFGPIDVWINNAMVSVFAPVIATSAAEYRRVTEVTYLGVVHGTLAALEVMRPRDAGVIVQVGSALAHRAIPLQSAYCAAKHAVQGFTESLRCELLHDRSGVRVTTVNLPALNTPQFDWTRSHLPRRAQPVPPIYQPELAARAILWAAEHPRRELSVGWPTVTAIHGNKLAAGLADRWLARRAWEGQQTREPEDPDRPDNLWRPVEGDQGAHGRFDGRARAASPLLWLSTHRALVAAGLLAAGAVLAGRRGRRGGAS